MKKLCGRSWTVTQGAIVFLSLGMAFAGVADGATMEARVTGTIYASTDTANVLDYGGSSLADGHRTTLTFRWSTTTAPPDYYGGARFPVEADYTTSGVPSWIDSTVKFDNGVTWHSSAYGADWFINDQVKIQDNCHFCSGSFPGSTSPVWDSCGINDALGGVTWYPTGAVKESYQANARIWDHTETLIQQLAIDQAVAWTPGAPGSGGADGYFNFSLMDDRDATQDFKANGYLLPDSFVVLRVPDPMPIDIQPGSAANRINLKKPGNISVAVLSSADFHTPDRVDRTR